MDNKTSFRNYPANIRRVLLLEWCSPVELLKLLVPYALIYPKEREDPPYHDMLLDILIPLFLKTKTFSDVKLCCQFIQIPPGKKYVKLILDKPDFQSTFNDRRKKILKLSGITGLHRLKLFYIFNHGKVTTDPSEIRHEDRDTALAQQLCDIIPVKQKKRTATQLLEDLNYRLNPKNPTYHLFSGIEDTLEEIASLPPLEIERHFIKVLNRIDTNKSGRHIYNAIQKFFFVWNPNFIIKEPQNLIKALLSEFKSQDQYVRRYALETVTLLLSGVGSLETTELKQLVNPSLEMLYDQDKYVYKAALEVVDMLWVQYEKTKIWKLITSCLESLANIRTDFRVKHLEVIALLIPKFTTLGKTEVKQLFDALLMMLCDKNEQVGNAALKIVGILIHKFEIEQIDQLITLYLEKLDSESVGLRVTSLKALALLIIRLEAKEIQKLQLIQRLLTLFNEQSDDDDIRRSTLKTVTVVISVPEIEIDINMAQQWLAHALKLLDQQYRSAVRESALWLIAALIETKIIKEQKDLDNVLPRLIQCLRDNRQDIRKTAFDVLSKIVVDYPEQKYTLNTQGNRYVEEIALIKTREMLAMIQAPADQEYISHSTLKNVLDNSLPKTKQTGSCSFFFRFSKGQNRNREALNTILDQNKLCYAKNETQTAITENQLFWEFFPFSTEQDSDDEALVNHVMARFG